MVRYTKKNLTDPVFEFENDYIIEEVDAHVPISGTNKTVRIVSDKGNKTNPNANPLSGTNMELIENALVDLNKLDVDHNITINPVNTYFTDSEIFNYMITNGYKLIKASGVDVRFHPDLGNGILTFSIGDTKYSTMYESYEDELRKRTIGTLTGLTLDNNYLHIVNTTDVDNKLETVYETIGLTNDRVDQLFETTNAYLESSSVEAPSSVVWTTVEQKLNIKTAPRTHVSNAAKLAFDDTLAYTFNCIENGAYNVSPLFSVSNTAGVARTLTVKLYRYVDGITDTLIQTWPAMIIDRENDTFAPLTYQFNKGIVGTEKYYITFVTDGAGVTSNGFLLNVGLVIDDQVVPASVTTDQVYSKNVTGYPDNTTSTTIFNALNTKTQNINADVNGTTFSNGIALTKVQAPLPGDISNHISVYDNTNGIGFNNNAMTYVSQFNTHKFTNPSSVVYAVIKDVIDEPKSLVTKEYAESNFGRTKFNIDVSNVADADDYWFNIAFTPALPIGTTIKVQGWGQKRGAATGAKTYPAFMVFNDDRTSRSVAIKEETFEPASGTKSTGRLILSSVSSLGMVWQPGVEYVINGVATFHGTNIVVVNGNSHELPTSANDNMICHASVGSKAPTAGADYIYNMVIGAAEIDDLHLICEVDMVTTPTITHEPNPLSTLSMEDVDPEVNQ